MTVGMRASRKGWQQVMIGLELLEMRRLHEMLEFPCEL